MSPEMQQLVKGVILGTSNLAFNEVGSMLGKLNISPEEVERDTQEAKAAYAALDKAITALEERERLLAMACQK